MRTGVVQRLGDWLTVKAGNSETRLLMLLMLAVGILGSVMSSTGVIAIFIPVALRIAQSTGISACRLMLPMSVPPEMDEMLPAPDKATQTIACLLLMVGLMISGVVPNVQAVLIVS
ncbi:hypothetical protein JWG43_16895 [Desulfobulbus alkaliphilus]|nr:SLC13 family permease [Desulfobulbus alkaliphilus]MBM9538751.1 hypothetical protein [Desulfobulbus alkaliphilus]